MKSAVRGQFYFLYMLLDIWSRKMVGWNVHDRESSELATDLFCATCATLDLDPEGLVFHADNGSPMKGSTLLATLHQLGVVPSFSRPCVRDDNPYSEALFRTAKYRPDFPEGPFASLQDARRNGPSQPEKGPHQQQPTHRTMRPPQATTTLTSTAGKDHRTHD